MKNHPISYRFNLLGVHLIFWGLYVLSEYLANTIHLQGAQRYLFLRSILLSLPALILAAYFISWYVVPKYLQANKWLPFIIWISLIGLFLFYARIKWLELINYLEHDQHYRIPPSKVVKNVIRDYAIVALAVCIQIISDYWKRQKLNEALIKAKAEAEIKLLKGQLHPHFLFNSLNNIYSLALVKSDHTADSILMLTELLDYLVYRANMETVPLGKELQLLQNYIGLEKLRYGDKLQVQMDIETADENRQLAPLLLLPFAENSFKHGGVGPQGYFQIDIQLQLHADRLYFHISNSKKSAIEKKNLPGGVGLQNIKQRLQLIYPNRHQLTITDRKESFRVELVINLGKNEEI